MPPPWLRATTITLVLVGGLNAVNIHEAQERSLAKQKKEAEKIAQERRAQYEAWQKQQDRQREKGYGVSPVNPFAPAIGPSVYPAKPAVPSVSFLPDTNDGNSPSVGTAFNVDPTQINPQANTGNSSQDGWVPPQRPTEPIIPYPHYQTLHSRGDSFRWAEQGGQWNPHGRFVGLPDRSPDQWTEPWRANYSRR